MIAIIDYGVGNLFSLKSSIKAIDEDAIVSSDAKTIKSADKIILPGVGAFGDAIKKLRENGLDQVVLDEVKKGKLLLGICLGMQLLFDTGEEYGVHEGLGLIKGKVISMEGRLPANLKVPHMGWNSLIFPKDKEISPLFKDLKSDDCVYFVHSYFGSECGKDIIAYTEYGNMITAAVGNDNIFGCQFHPEKSGEVGLKILKNFCCLKM